MKRSLAFALLLSAGVGLAQDEPDLPAEKGRTHVAIDNGGHLGLITGMAFTADGKRLFTAGRDRTVQAWDPETGDRVHVMRPPTGGFGHGAIRGMALLRATGPGGVSAVVVADSGIHDPRDHDRLLNRLIVFNRQSGQVQSLDVPQYGPKGWIEAIAANRADGGTVATSRGSTVLVHSKLDRLWLGDSAALKSHRRFDAAKKTVHGLGLSPNGKRLAAVTLGDEPTLFLWDVPGDKLLTSARLSSWGQAVAWSPDGKQFAVALSTGGASVLKNPALQVYSAAGKVVKSFLPNELSKRYESGKGQTNFYAYNVAFRSDTEVLTTIHWGNLSYGSEQVVAVNLKTDKARELLYREKLTSPHLGHAEGPLPIAVTSDGTLAAVPTAPRGQRIAWIDLTGKEKEKVRYSGAADAIGWSVGWKKDGPTIGWNGTGKRVSVSNVLNLQALEAETGTFAADDFVRASHSRDDGWAVAAKGKASDFRLSITKDGKPVAETDPSKRVIESYTLSAAGKPWLAWSDRGSLRVGDPATGKQTSYLHPGGGRVPGMASSPDGRYLLVSSTRDLLRVYRVRGAGKEAYPLLNVYARGPDWVAWTSEGYYAATPGGERMLGWRVNEGLDRLATHYPASRFRKQFYRPDLIAKLLDAGSVKAALEALGQKAAVAVEEMLPPAVEISVEGDEMKTLTVKATAKARSKGQPVTSLRLLLDGRPFGPPLELKGQADVTHSFEVELTAGKHDLAVLARSPSASNVSAVVTKTRNEQRDARLLSLFVGIDKYWDKSLELKAAANDARALAAALKVNAGKPLFAHVDEPKLLLDEGATKKGILKELTDLRAGRGKELTANDLVVVSYAGHGVKVGKEFYLLPVEATEATAATKGVSGAELRAALRDWPCQVVLILDACHSNAGGQAIVKGKPATDDAARDLSDDDVSVVVVSAAMGHEKAIERLDPKTKQPRGLFSKALEEALSKAEGVPFNRSDRYIYLHHAFGHAFDRVKYDSDDQQHPFLALPWTVESFRLIFKSN